MELGLNLSFAVKRWIEPEVLAKMCKEDFKVNRVQFTWDLIDPWWPTEERDLLTEKYKEAFAKYDISIDATFGGLASYTYAQLLAPDKIQREISFTFLKRAIDLSIALGAKVMGTPIGGMSNNDANNLERRELLYKEALDYICKLASYGKENGLEEIHIEATPLLTEFPHSPAETIKLMKDLEGKTAIPVKMLIDWGHALYKPIMKEDTDFLTWLNTCKEYIGSIHLQQTDGQLDRHWDFTKEGIVTKEAIEESFKVEGLESLVQYLEVVTAFEERDDIVYEGIKKSMDYLHEIFA